MTDDAMAWPTLGRRLDIQARWLATRLLPSFPWAGPLQAFLDRTTSLTASFDGRFERFESSPGSLERWMPASDGTWIYAAPVPTVPRTGANGGTAAGLRGHTPEGRPLAADVRARLREVAGDSADALRVHDDDAADALARGHRADAVTLGRDVYFRQGRFRPRDDRGFALLAHEATHVLALLRPGTAWRRATGAGVAAEETDALTRERAIQPRPTSQVNGRTTSRPLPTAPPGPYAAPGYPAPSHPSPGAPAAHPMRAPEDRDTAPAPVEPLDVEALRRGLLNDVMRRLKTEFERGG